MGLSHPQLGSTFPNTIVNINPLQLKQVTVMLTRCSKTLEFRAKLEIQFDQLNGERLWKISTSHRVKILTGRPDSLPNFKEEDLCQRIEQYKKFLSAQTFFETLPICNGIISN